MPQDTSPIAAAGKNFWRQSLAPYAVASQRRAVLDLALSVVPYLGLSVAMYFSLRVSYLLALLIAVPAAGFLVRTYIVFHDCTHGSFLPSRRANRWVGTALGLLVFTTFESWKQDHAVHHATAGDLDRRGRGDVPVMTVAEYQAQSPRGQLGYRLFRNPLVMFGLGPMFAMVISPRRVPKSARPRVKQAVRATNLALLLMVGGLCVAIGWENYLLIQLPTIMIAGAAGVWLFYVQHQFEDVYWETGACWDYADAALQGSSYLRLPKVLQFFSGNIGLHHVHHLSARIPNYNLQRAHDDNAIFHDVPVLSLADGLRAVRLKLYDEASGRMVTFAEAARSPAAGAEGAHLEAARHVSASPVGRASPTI